MDASDSAPARRGGNAKVSREDWLALAERVLVADGVAELKVMALAARMGVSRSSFYWYFESRDDLLGQLLDRWEAKNTAAVLEHAARPAETISAAVMNIFECWIDPALFDPRLDFAVREWARRSDEVRARVDRADAARVAGLREMFARYGYAETDAFIRARIVYFMQIGYYALVEAEPIEARVAYLRPYLVGFTGVDPAEAELRAFADRARARLARARG